MLNNVTKDLLTTNELAQRWKLRPQTLRKWRKQNKGPNYILINNTVRYEFDTIVQYEKSNLKKTNK